jgi:hypothetical protein
MGAKWIMFFYFVFLAGTLISSVVELETTISVDHASIIAVLMQPEILVSNSTGIDVLSVISVPINMVKALWNTVSWNYGYLNDAAGNPTILRMFMWAFSIGFIWGSAQLIRGTSA